MQDEVNDAYDGLAKAYFGLRLVPNKDMLNELINKANGLNAANYSASTWSVLSEALEKANMAMANENASQEEVDAAYETLNSAIVGLTTDSEMTNSTVDESITNGIVKAGDTTAGIKTGDSVDLEYSLVSLALASMLLVINKKRKYQNN